MIEPGLVTGIGPQASWYRRMTDYIRSLRILPGNGYRVKQLTGGVILEFPDRGGLGGAPLSINLFVCNGHGLTLDTSVGGADYVLGVPQNAAAGTGTAPTPILKPSLLWFSIKSRQVYGGINYSQWSGQSQSRLATNPVGSATEYITPLYLAGDLLWTVPVNYNGQKVQLDLNVDGRVFAAP